MPEKALLLVCLFCLPSFAQTNVVGEVYDSLSLKPLGGATVTLRRTGKAVSFARTDREGRFSVAAMDGDSLQVTFLGYMKKSVPATVGRKVRIPLAQKAFMLDEVRVKGLPVFGRQDTTVFDLKRYANLRDNSLKDVLRRLPGVDVDDNGHITFNGKDITRFTVEDLDLAGGRYNRLTEAIRAADVDRAEVVEHDQPVKALQGKVFTDDVAMNIRLRPEVRDKWMLTLRVGAVAGFPLEKTRPLAAADALQIGARRQWLYTAEHDQSGRDLSLNDRLIATGGTAAYDASASVPQWFAAPEISAPIAAERLRFNSSYDFTAKNTRKTATGSEQRLTAGYLHTDENQTTGNTSTYFFDGGTPVVTTQTDRSDTRRDMAYIDFNHNTNTDKTYGNEHLRLDFSRTDGVSLFGGDADGSVRQRVRLSEFHAANTFTRLLSGERHSWNLSSNVGFHYAPQEMTVYGQRERMKNTLYHADNNATLTLTRPRLTHRYAFGLSVEHLNLRGHNTQLCLYATPQWEYRRKLTVARLSLPLRWETFAERGKGYIDASPSLRLTLKGGMRSEWNVGVGYAMKTGGWTGFAVSGYKSDYRTTVITDGTIPRHATLYANADYTYKRPVKEFFVSVGADFSHFNGNTMTDMSITDGCYLLKTVARRWHSHAVSGKVAVSKGFFDLHLKTKIDLRGTHSVGRQLSDGTLTRYSANVWSASPEVVFAPSFGAFTYRATFRLNDIKAGGNATGSLFCWEQRLAYTQTVGNVDITLSAAHYRNELQTAGVVNTLLADAAVTWRIKKVRLTANVRNLFDKRRYEVINYSGVMSSTSYYELRPREAVVTLQCPL